MFQFLIFISLSVFLIGMLGIIINIRRNIISLLMSIELIFLAVNINLLIFANYWQNFVGHIFVLFILAISAAEMAVMLISLVLYFNNQAKVNNTDLINLRN